VSADAYFVIGAFLLASSFIRLNKLERADPNEVAKYSANTTAAANFVVFAMILAAFYFAGAA